MKTTEIKASQLADGLAIADLMVTAGIVKSKGEAKRMIQQKGVYLNDAGCRRPVLCSQGI